MFTNYPRLHLHTADSQLCMSERPLLCTRLQATCFKLPTHSKPLFHFPHLAIQLPKPEAQEPSKAFHFSHMELVTKWHQCRFLFKRLKVIQTSPFPLLRSSPHLLPGLLSGQILCRSLWQESLPNFLSPLSEPFILWASTKVSLLPKPSAHHLFSTTNPPLR